jgi:glycerate 2-kinase
MTDKRPLLRAIFDAAVAAAHPDVILSAHLPAPPKGRIICLAAGKGAAAMAAAAEAHYLDTLKLDPARLTGIATTRHGHGVPTRRIRVVEAGHPVPDEAGLKGADDSACKLAAEATCRRPVAGADHRRRLGQLDRAGGGITFQQKQQLNRALLRSGAVIGEINTVRKHLSRIKGGRLARAGQKAEIVTLAISDVPHDDPAVIASGPTVPDTTTLADARAIVAKFNLAIDDAVRARAQRPRQ